MQEAFKSMYCTREGNMAVGNDAMIVSVGCCTGAAHTSLQCGNSCLHANPRSCKPFLSASHVTVQL